MHSEARAADDEMVRERQAEAEARQHQVDAELLDDPFANRPSRSNGGGAVAVKALNEQGARV